MTASLGDGLGFKVQDLGLQLRMNEVCGSGVKGVLFSSTLGVWGLGFRA